MKTSPALPEYRGKGNNPYFSVPRLNEAMTAASASAVSVPMHNTMKKHPMFGSQSTTLSLHTQNHTRNHK